MNSALAVLKSHFTYQSNYFRYAIRMALSCTVIVTLYEVFHLKHGYWAAFSVIACVWPTVGSSIQRTKHRIIGTFIGMWIGIIVAHLFGSNQWMIDILLPIFIFLTFYLKPYSYQLFVTFTTVVTVLFICLIVPGNWQIAITRLIMTGLGVFIALLATLFILPSHASHTLPQQFTLIKDSIQDYYSMICRHYLKPENHYFQTIQSKAFTNLQATLAILTESQQESWHLSKAYRKNATIYQTLYKLYHHLMILEIHLPCQMNTASLIPVYQELEPLLTSIATLLHKKEGKLAYQSKKQLTVLLKQVEQERIKASFDMSIQTATFPDHVQLTIFIETLIKFINELMHLRF